MIYIHTALKSEAQAIVDKYKLIKNKINKFTIFTNENIVLIISGIGVSNAKEATNKLMNYFNINENDIILNIGICAADDIYKVGELIEISSISYYNKTIQVNEFNKKHIVCLDTQCANNKYEIVDMESYGFCEAAKNLKNIRIYKVVSDNFEPNIVTKINTKILIFDVIEDIIKNTLENQ
ncbi:MAG: hypothetical protein COB17_08405 [Sulfurimonas sp.]|nr:MAG: hypothetical protein COB17_08405 [Sulfurimonas sp.]